MTLSGTIKCDQYQNNAGTGAFVATFGTIGAHTGDIDTTTTTGTVTMNEFTNASTPNKSILTFTTAGLTGALTVKLPTTNVKKGMVFVVSLPNNVTYSNILTLQSSGANQIDQIARGYIKVQAQVDTPTAAADWTVVEVQEDYSASVTHTFSGGGTAAAATLRVSRYNNLVTGWETSVLGTPSGSSNTLNSPTGTIPTRFQPAGTVPQICRVQFNGSTSSEPGRFEILSNGTIQIVSSISAGTNFTAGSSGSNPGCSFSYSKIA